jgi:hypothetical protein
VIEPVATEILWSFVEKDKPGVVRVRWFGSSMFQGSLELELEPLAFITFVRQTADGFDPTPPEALDIARDWAETAGLPLLAEVRKVRTIEAELESEACPDELEVVEG